MLTCSAVYNEKELKTPLQLKPEIRYPHVHEFKSNAFLTERPTSRFSGSTHLYLYKISTDVPIQICIYKYNFSDPYV